MWGLAKKCSAFACIYKYKPLSWNYRVHKGVIICVCVHIYTVYILYLCSSRSPCLHTCISPCVWLIYMVCFTSSFSHCHWVPRPPWPPGCCRPGSRGWHRSRAGWRSHRRADGRTWPTLGWWGEGSARLDRLWPESPQPWHWSGPEGEQFLGMNVFLHAPGILLQHNDPIFTAA